MSLVDIAKKHADTIVMSIYLNPMQFNNEQDLATYPSNLKKDLELARGRGVDIAFCPTGETMCPAGFQTYVETTGITRGLCGATRPGYFRGVTTVVTKLFNIVKPDVAIFGEKDYQQLRVIERMVRDLDMDIEIIAAPLVREEDGIAMSSRNVRLAEEERRESREINRALKEAAESVRRGERDINKIVKGVKERIGSTKTGRIDYINICDPATLEELKTFREPALLAVAAYFGETRLIDNCVLDRL